MHVETYMVALGFEICARCDRRFEDGEGMSAVVYECGDVFGWCCEECVLALKGSPEGEKK